MIGIRLSGLLAAALATLVLAGCGSSDDQIPVNTAKTMDANLTTLQDQIGSDDCTGASETLTAINNEANELSGEVKRGMRLLLDQLEGLFAEQCDVLAAPTTSTTTSTSSSSSPTSSTTESTEPTTSSSTTESSTTSSTSTTNTDTTPPGSGGGGSGGGGSGTGGTAPGGGIG